MSVAEYNEISQYKDLKIEIEQMWHPKTTNVSIIKALWVGSRKV